MLIKGLGGIFKKVRIFKILKMKKKIKAHLMKAKNYCSSKIIVKK